MKHVLNAIGLACPLPVVKTKDMINGISDGDTVEVLVDNEIAVQNLTKFANVRGHGVRAEKVSDDEYHVFVTKAGNGGEAADIKETACEEAACIPDMRGNDVAVISSRAMGNGDDKLGAALMKAFIFALTKQDRLPKTVLLYNSGAFLSCEGSESVEDLKLLEAGGTEILTCGTCLNFYGLTEKLAVGGITNMYDIVEKMTSASKVIRP